MMSKMSKADRARVAYNRAVLAWLQVNAPAHAEALYSRGIALGWWDSVHYLRSVGKTAPDCGRMLAEKPLS